MNESSDFGKFIDFQESEIAEYVEKIRSLIRLNQYQISRRDVNEDFYYDFRIDSKKEKEILLDLDYLDFCYAVPNRKIEYAHEILYVFKKEVLLDNWGEIRIVEIYIKTNLTQTKSGRDQVIVVSFHERDKELRYLFKKN